MIKKILLILLAVIIYINGKTQINDTLFVKKDEHQKIYIEKNRKSKYYSYLKNFSHFKNLKNDKIISQGLNSKWVKIYKYKGKYILYAPCDWSVDTKIIISNNKIQIRGFETYIYSIVSIIKLNKRQYKIEYLNYDKQKNNLDIKVINYKKGIFEFTINNQGIIDKFWMLYSKNIKQYDILVNDCLYERTSEFEFDK